MKVGILINEGRITRFYSELINEIKKIDNVEIVYLVLQNGKEKSNGKTSFWYSFLLFSLYLKLERKISKSSKYPLAYVNLPEDSDTKKIVLKNIANSPYSEISASDIQLLEEENLDVCLRVGWGIIKGDVLNVAKHGIWSLHHGDNNYFRGKPALFWEYYQNKELTGAILQRLTNTLDGGFIIDRLYTNVNRYFITKGYYSLYYSSLTMVIENLMKVKEKGFIIEKKEVQGNIMYEAPLYKMPNILKQSQLIFKLLGRNFTRKLKLQKKQWYLYANNTTNKTLLYRYKKIENRKGYFSADPFIWEQDNSTYVFYEEVKLSGGKGHISVFDMHNPNDKKVVLKENFHLSFPNVFSHNGDLFMLPETRQNNTISLYKNVSFPDKWEFHCHLMENVSACDSEVFEYQGKFYLFTCLNTNPYLTDTSTLYIFHADTLEGPYEQHALNPIMRDARYARLGGKIQKIDNKLIRVSQNHSFGYGSQLNLHEITKLSPVEYEENILQTITPAIFKAKGIHTLNISNKAAIIDVYK
jgi:hypothetical protein